MKNVFLICLITIFISGCWTTQKGEKIGTLVKLAQEGIIFKTNEAELIRGGMNGGNGGFGVKPFFFTIENNDLLPTMQNALDGQKEIKIHYHTELFVLFRSDSDNNFLDSVEVMNK